MADTTLIQTNFSGGLYFNTAPWKIPSNGFNDGLDFLAGVAQSYDGADASGRRGWIVSSSASTAGRTGITAVQQFSAADRVVGLATSTNLYVWPGTSTGAVSDYGTIAVTTPTQNPVEFNEHLIFTHSGSAVKVSTTYGASTLGGGVPVSPLYATTYKSRLVLGNVSGTPERVQFSAPLNPDSWSASAYIDTTHPIKALATSRNGILVFSEGRTERVRGNVPPPGGDMVLEPLFNEGTSWPFSVCYLDDSVVFANLNGLWVTDGSAIDNLAEQARIAPYWAALAADATTFSNFHIAVGSYKDWLVVTSFANNSTTFSASDRRYSWAINSKTKYATRLSNTPFLCMANANRSSDLLVAGLAGHDRFAIASTMFGEASTTLATLSDAWNSGGPTATVQTRMFVPGDKFAPWRFRDCYITYTSTGSVTVSAETHKADGTADSTSTVLTGTAHAIKRVRVPVAERGFGVSFLLTGETATAFWPISIELTSHPVEQTRRS